MKLAAQRMNAAQPEALAGHLVPYVAAVKDPHPVMFLYGNVCTITYTCKLNATERILNFSTSKSTPMVAL